MTKALASTLLRRLKETSLNEAPVKAFLQRLNQSLSLMYQSVHCFDVSILIYVPVRRRDDVTARSRMLNLVIKEDQFYLGTRQYVFFGISGDSVSLRYQLVRC